MVSLRLLPAIGVTVHHPHVARRQNGGVPVIDVAALRPDATQVVLVGGLLADVGVATAAELSADLRLPVVTVAAALRALERSGRARRVTDGWEQVDTGPRPPRRSWRVGGDWTG